MTGPPAPAGGNRAPNHIYVAGLSNVSGDFTGYYDTATAQTYVSATDGQPRNFYLYPSTLGTEMPQYFFGQIYPDYSLSGAVTAAVTLKSNWVPASPIYRYPTYLSGLGIPGS